MKEIEVKLRRLFAAPVNRAVVYRQGIGRDAWNGSVWAEIEVCIPNQSISGDVRRVVQTIRLANLEFIPTEEGDEVEA